VAAHRDEIYGLSLSDGLSADMFPDGFAFDRPDSLNVRRMLISAARSVIERFLQ
jgi:hypothetical protein